MRLTTFADLGLRSMMILGDLPEGERLTIADLAKATNASDNHLARVIAKLVEMKLVVSVRGEMVGRIYRTRPCQCGKNFEADRRIQRSS